MLAALSKFEACMRRARALDGLHAALSNQVTEALDLSEILRAEIVLAVSALDTFVHELTRLGMMECYTGNRPKTDAFDRFQIPMSRVTSLTAVALEEEIRLKHGYLTFQHPDKIGDAVRLFSCVKLWNEVAKELGTDAYALKRQLTLVVDRRNKIAHEGDLNPSLSGGEAWPIDRHLVQYTFDLIEKIARAIFQVAT